MRKTFLKPFFLHFSIQQVCFHHCRSNISPNRKTILTSRLGKKNFLQYCYSIFSKFQPRPFSLCSSVCWNLHKIHSSGNQASVCPCICVFCSLRLRSGLSCSFHRRSIFPPSSVFVGARGKSAQSNTLNESCVPLISSTGKSPPLHMIHTHTHSQLHTDRCTHIHTHTGSFIHEVVSVSCVQRCEWSRCESPL